MSAEKKYLFIIKMYTVCIGAGDCMVKYFSLALWKLKFKMIFLLMTSLSCWTKQSGTEETVLYSKSLCEQRVCIETKKQWRVMQKKVHWVFLFFFFFFLLILSKYRSLSVLDTYREDLFFCFPLSAVQRATTDEAEVAWQVICNQGSDPLLSEQLG